MPGGKYDKTSSNRVDIENDDDEGVQTDFEVARNNSVSNNPINYKSGTSRHISSTKLPN